MKGRRYDLAVVARIAALSIATLVAALSAASASSFAARVRPLQSWAKYTWHPPVGVTSGGYISPRRLKTLPPGVYRMQVIASEAFGFQLIGPGVNRHTRVSSSLLAGAAATNTTWTVRLRRGLYQYRAIGVLASSYKGVIGWFRVG